MVVAAKDYRNAGGCPSLADVKQKKDALEKRIRQEQSHRKIIYNAVRNKSDCYFVELASIYNQKCAYCGAKIGHTDIKLFEVDHFICESSYSNDTTGRAEAGKVSNLVLSCFLCNRGKGDLLIEGKYRELLNPDDGSISTVFIRDDNYYIRIENTYSDDSFIQVFFKELMLESELIRLDYLLLEISDLISIKRAKSPELAAKLEQCMSILLQRKNATLT